MPFVAATRIRLAGILVLLLASGGCAATSTAVAKRQLDVQSKMTDTIFLDPVPPEERTVYVEVKNSSDKPDFVLAPQIRQSIAARGWRVVEDPRLARYLLQANVLQAGRNAKSAAEKSYEGGFGSVVTGGALGGAAGYGVGQLGANNRLAAIGGALAGAAIATVADAWVQDVTYSVIADLQVSERVPAGMTVNESVQANLPQGSAGTRTLTSSTMSDWQRYRTRIVSTAERANLDWPEAAPQLVDGLSRTIAGIF